jgi:hypothetical protein
MDSRAAWKEHITKKLESKGHKITPWLKAHIHYLSLLSPEQYRAEIAKFKAENPDQYKDEDKDAAPQGIKPESDSPKHQGNAELGAST